MKKYKFTGAGKEAFAQLQEAVDNIDVEACLEIMQQWPNT